MSLLEGNYNNVCFVFISLLVAISCLSFDRSNKTDHVPTKEELLDSERNLVKI